MKLDSCKLGDVGGASVGEGLGRKMCGEFKHISMRNNDIADEGGKRIGHGIEGNKHIISLNLSNNEINDAGGEILA